MLTNRRLIFLLLVVGLVAGYVQIALGAEAARISPVLDRILAKKELVVGTAGDMAPLNMTTKDGQIIGLEADLAHYISGSMEVKLTLKPMHFNELIPALEAGKIDIIISGMTITPLRNLKVAFVGPYFISGKSILVKKAKIGLMKELSQMNQPERIFVALKGSTSQQFVERFLPKAKLLLSDDYGQGLAMVKEDKAEAMVADFPFCQISVYRNPEADLATLNSPLNAEPLGMAILANDLLLMNWLQNFITTMEKTGEMRMLGDRWFKDFSWLPRIR